MGKRKGKLQNRMQPRINCRKIFGLRSENKLGEFLSKSLLASQNCDRLILKNIAISCCPYAPGHDDDHFHHSMKKGWAN
jgi:hypothetical protein